MLSNQPIDTDRSWATLALQKMDRSRRHRSHLHRRAQPRAVGGFLRPCHVGGVGFSNREGTLRQRRFACWLASLIWNVRHLWRGIGYVLWQLVKAILGPHRRRNESAPYWNSAAIGT